MRYVIVIILVLIILALSGLIVIYSGTFNVAATSPDVGIVRWILNETMDNSVQHHAKTIVTPPLDDAAKIQNGFALFDRSCAGCHGAPGRERGGRGFNPEPPSLVTVLDDWTPAELFWIIKNGIKMTGMPASGQNRSDDDIWAIVAFMRTLPNVTPELYLKMKDSVRAAQSADTTRRPR
jgi:mono/diheme cytochrome c family protein